MGAQVGGPKPQGQYGASVYLELILYKDLWGNIFILRTDY